MVEEGFHLRPIPGDRSQNILAFGGGHTGDRLATRELMIGPSQTGREEECAALDYWSTRRHTKLVFDPPWGRRKDPLVEVASGIELVSVVEPVPVP